MAVVDGRALGLALLAAGCAAPAYRPLPVALPATLPAEAFARCKAVVAQRYGSLAMVDAAAFRIQSDWAYGADDPPLERRATVFRDRGELMVVVEVRWLAQPTVGLPHWTSPRGDADAENRLAEALQAALADAAPADAVPADDAPAAAAPADDA